MHSNNTKQTNILNDIRHNSHVLIHNTDNVVPQEHKARPTNTIQQSQKKHKRSITTMIPINTGRISQLPVMLYPQKLFTAKIWHGATFVYHTCYLCGEPIKITYTYQIRQNGAHKLSLSHRLAHQYCTSRLYKLKKRGIKIRYIIPTQTTTTDQNNAHRSTPVYTPSLHREKLQKQLDALTIFIR